MRVLERVALQRLYKRVDELEAKVAKLEAKKSPGRPKKVPENG